MVQQDEHLATSVWSKELWGLLDKYMHFKGLVIAEYNGIWRLETDNQILL